MAEGDYKVYTKTNGEQIRVRIVREDAENDSYRVSSGAATYDVHAADLQDEDQVEQLTGAQEASGAPQERQAPPLTTNQTAGEANTNPDAAATDQNVTRPSRSA